MTQYRKKPVVIDATQWFKNGDHPVDYIKDVTVTEDGVLRTYTGDEAKSMGWEGYVVRYYRHPSVPGTEICKECGRIANDHGWVDTLEGGHRVCPGDYVITGIKGEIYPCKPDIFIATYEAEVEKTVEQRFQEFADKIGMRFGCENDCTELPAMLQEFVHAELLEMKEAVTLHIFKTARGDPRHWFTSIDVQKLNAMPEGTMLVAVRK